MGSVVAEEKPHAVCIPYPAQGHITPLLKLAKLLHSSGFYITFVNTEFNHNRLLRSAAATTTSLSGVHDFRFETIPDGLPPSEEDATQHIPSLCESIAKNCLTPFKDLLTNLNDPSSSSPPVTYIVSDLFMSFTLLAADELCIPVALFWSASACGLLGYLHYPHLVSQGFVPLKDESDLTNGYLETPIETILGIRNMRLKDLPSFIRTTDPNEIIFNYICKEIERIPMAKSIIINTFEELEKPVLDLISPMLPPVFVAGPISLLSRRKPAEETLASIASNLWKEDTTVMQWLEGRDLNSVIYVNFGSVTVMSKLQLIEFAWGLANSGHDFLWVVRQDVVKGEATAEVPPEFLAATGNRGIVSRWCPQEDVLLHPSVGGFLTHGGWNSILESVCGGGVPVICWPFFAEQQTNCRYLCDVWGVGMEMESVVRREEVERMIRELMGGEKGRERRNKAREWKESAMRAIEPGGSSWVNFEKIRVLLAKE